MCNVATFLIRFCGPGRLVCYTSINVSSTIRSCENRRLTATPPTQQRWTFCLVLPLLQHRMQAVWSFPPSMCLNVDTVVPGLNSGSVFSGSAQLPSTYKHWLKPAIPKLCGAQRYILIYCSFFQFISIISDRPWGPPSLLYNGYRVLPGGKAAGGWRWPATPI